MGVPVFRGARSTSSFFMLAFFDIVYSVRVFCMYLSCWLDLYFGWTHSTPDKRAQNMFFAKSPLLVSPTNLINSGNLFFSQTGVVYYQCIFIVCWSLPHAPHVSIGWDLWSSVWPPWWVHWSGGVCHAFCIPGILGRCMSHSAYMSTQEQYNNEG